MSADNSPENNKNERPRQRDAGDASLDEELAQLSRALAAEAPLAVVRMKPK